MSSGHEQPDSVTRFETALVVDNDAIMVKFMRKLLNEAGLTVVTAQDGLAALDLLTSIRPDLILVDLVMPNIDGRALCRIIRSKPDFAKIPIVVISAIASEEDFNAADLGANACIAKGTFTDIAVHVNTLLDNPELLTDNRLGGKILGIKKLFPRRTTEELLDTSRHYQVMLDSITNGILEVNANHRVIFCNPAALSIFSLTREQLLGRHIDQLFNTDAILVVGRLLSDKRLKDSDPDARITVRGREISVPYRPNRTATTGSSSWMISPNGRRHEPHCCWPTGSSIPWLRATV
jgi:PAS domain S-box-containing protein